MKIALLTDGIPPYVVGGMQQHSYSLAKYLVLNGNEVTLFHFVKKGQPIPSEYEINTHVSSAGVAAATGAATFALAIVSAMLATVDAAEAVAANEVDVLLVALLS